MGNKMHEERLLEQIVQADCNMLNEIMDAVRLRYKTVFPEWEIIYLAIPKQDSQERREQLEAMIHYLQGMQ